MHRSRKRTTPPMTCAFVLIYCCAALQIRERENEHLYKEVQAVAPKGCKAGCGGSPTTFTSGLKAVPVSTTKLSAPIGSGLGIDLVIVFCDEDLRWLRAW
jgi:hypothetical protein